MNLIKVVFFLNKHYAFVDNCSYLLHFELYLSSVRSVLFPDREKHCSKEGLSSFCRNFRKDNASSTSNRTKEMLINLASRLSLTSIDMLI